MTDPLFTVTFPIEAPDADEAWRRFRRMVRYLPAAELGERCLVEEVVGRLYDDVELSPEELEARLPWPEPSGMARRWLARLRGARRVRAAA